MKISEAFVEYCRREVRGRGLSVNTEQAYRNTAVALIRCLGDINIKKLSLDAINDFYLDAIGPNGYKHPQMCKDTARKYISNVRCVLRFYRKKGVHVLNPDEIVLPRPEKKYPRFLDNYEYRKILYEVSTPYRGYSNLNRVRNTLIVKMLFHTGLRVSELCALNRDSIRNRQFVVVGKSKEPRPCFITKEIEGDIEQYLNMRSDNNPALFISVQNGERITPGGVQRVFRRLAQKTGISKVTPHTMRHSFATQLLEDGVDIRYVAAFLGHQNITTTKGYTHVRNSKLHQIYIENMETHA